MFTVAPRSLRAVALTSVLSIAVVSCGKSSSKQSAQSAPVVGGITGSSSKGSLSGLSSGDSVAREAERKKEAETLRKELEAIRGELSNVTAATTKVSGEVSLPSSVLGKEMLWGSDLQYAVQEDAFGGGIVENKVTVLGHKIARFVRVGDRVLLQSDETSEVESDSPRGLSLIEFKIVSDKDGMLTLNPVRYGSQSAAWLGVPALGFLPFLRSMEYSEKDGVLLYEISYQSSMSSNGTVERFDFIEAVQPRSNVVSAGAKGLEINPPDDENDASKFETLLARLGVFPTSAWLAPEKSPSSDAADDQGGLVNVTKNQHNFVTRFDIDGGKTIDWWVTSNTPESLLPDMKAGVEGWNRYYNEFRPEQPVMRFRGKLPAGVKVGDPRYNVVFFDAVADAPAAYESQAADPLTGIQSHSMIYLPFAWYNISDLRYLQDADDSANARGTKGAKASKSGLKGPAAKLWEAQEARGAIKCAMPSEYKTAPFLVNNRAADTADEAGRALVRSTLLHEVGHALGMAHNFKGTMTGDAAKYNETDWVFSSSTMDYNPFALEDTLFVDLDNPNRDVTKGLMQPYDRQFIDIVYNQGKGTQSRGEKALPYCDDADHEDTTNGVDPFCRQYDFFARPDQMLVIPTQRLASTEKYLPRHQGGFITLTGWMGDALAKAENQLEEIKDSKDDQPEGDQLAGLARSFTQQGVAAFTHFERTGSYSYTNALTRDMRMLGEWKPVDGVEKGTENTYRRGLNLVAKYVKDLFGADGDVNTDAYQAYTRKVQSQLTSRMAGLFSTGLDGAGGFSGDEKLLVAVNAVKEAQSKLFVELLAKADSQDKAKLKGILSAQSKSLDSSLDKVLAGSSQRVIDELIGITVTNAAGEPVNARPAVRGEQSHALYLGLAKLAARSSVTLATRKAAVEALKAQGDNAERYASSYKVETLDENGKTVKLAASKVRATALKSLTSSLQSEKAPLDTLVKKNRYLSADQRETLEFLAGAVALLDGAAAE